MTIQVEHEDQRSGCEECFDPGTVRIELSIAGVYIILCDVCWEELVLRLQARPVPGPKLPERIVEAAARFAIDGGFRYDEDGRRLDGPGGKPVLGSARNAKIITPKAPTTLEALTAEVIEAARSPTPSDQYLGLMPHGHVHEPPHGNPLTEFGHPGQLVPPREPVLYRPDHVVKLTSPIEKKAGEVTTSEEIAERLPACSGCLHPKHVRKCPEVGCSCEIISYVRCANGDQCKGDGSLGGYIVSLPSKWGPVVCGACPSSPEEPMHVRLDRMAREVGVPEHIIELSNELVRHDEEVAALTHDTTVGALLTVCGLERAEVKIAGGEMPTCHVCAARRALEVGVDPQSGEETE